MARFVVGADFELDFPTREMAINFLNELSPILVKAFNKCRVIKNSQAFKEVEVCDEVLDLFQSS